MAHDGFAQKLYFWILFLLFLSLGLLIQVENASAMSAAEVEPGVIELSTIHEAGFEVKSVSEQSGMESKHPGADKVIYFCIQEKMSKTKDSSNKQKCFYGDKANFKDVKKGMVLNGLQYGLKNRQLRKTSYFYPALVLRPQI